MATADMGGLIQVWACPTGNLVQSFQIGDIEVQLHIMSAVLHYIFFSG